MIAWNMIFVGKNILNYVWVHKNIKNITIFDNQEVVAHFLWDIRNIQNDPHQLRI